MSMVALWECQSFSLPCFTLYFSDFVANIYLNFLLKYEWLYLFMYAKHLPLNYSQWLQLSLFFYHVRWRNVLFRRVYKQKGKKRVFLFFSFLSFLRGHGFSMQTDWIKLLQVKIHLYALAWHESFSVQPGHFLLFHAVQHTAQIK